MNLQKEQGLRAKDAKTLVLGANGRIGQALQVFAPQGMCWQARGLCTQAQQAPEDWHICAPLKERGALKRAAFGCDQILCLAGVVPGRGKDVQDNKALALAAVEAAAEAGCRRVLLTSSAAVYGAASGLLCEDQALTPLHPYGQAKAEMEQAAQARGQDLGVEVCSLRIGNVAGFDAILGGWKPGFSLDHFADGQSPQRSYIGVKTLAETLQQILACSDLPTALNLAQPGAMAMADLLRAADLPFESKPAPKSAIFDVAFDLSTLERCLGRAVPMADAKTLVAEWRLFCDKSQIL